VFVIDKKPKGSFLFEYAGELISKAEALHREKKYPRHLGSYLFFFKSGTKEFWYDVYIDNSYELLDIPVLSICGHLFSVLRKSV
jgi:hypothetical protein